MGCHVLTAGHQCVLEVLHGVSSVSPKMHTSHGVSCLTVVTIKFIWPGGYGDGGVGQCGVGLWEARRQSLYA